jgi:2-keto-4-pentenoate hydratase/2-oxohepta-3-ene-1,7-dioic acid hydratase in catechol pathway
LKIKTMLNERVVQESSTREMIFSVPDLISYISRITTLQPNDLILTGSPKRVGDEPDPRTPLKAGDTLRIEIEGLGVLINPVVEEELVDA